MTGNVHITEGSRLLIVLHSLRGTFYLGLAQCGAVLANLAIHAAIARWSDDAKVAVGQYGLVVHGCVMLVIGTLSLPGLGGAIQQSAARGHDGVLRLAYVGRVRFAWLGTLALLATAAGFYRAGDTTVAAALLLPAGVFPFLAATGSCGNFFRGRSLFGYAAAWEAGSKVLNAVAITVALLVTGNMIYGLWAFFTAMLIGNVVGYRWARTLARNEEVDAEYRRFGLHLSVMTFVATLELFADRPILRAFASEEILGIYMGAIILHNQFRMLVLLVAQTLHPRFSRCDGVRAAARMLAGVLVPMLLVMAAVCGLLWWLAPVLIRVIYDGRLPEAVPHARVLILAGVLFTPSLLMRTVLTAQRCVKHLYVYDVGFPLVQLGAWIAGARLYGLDGIVWARVIVLAAAQILMLILLLHAVRTHRAPTRELADPRRTPETE